MSVPPKPSFLERNESFTTIAAVAAFALAGCTSVTGDRVEPSKPGREVVSDTRCSNDIVALDTNFPAGNIASCTVIDDGQINITIAPEDDPPINCSAWYAFRLSPQNSAKVTVTLSYTHCGHRYLPKTSADGETWVSFTPDDVSILSDEKLPKAAKFDLSLEKGKPVFVSAQEIIGPVYYTNWMNSLSAKSSVSGLDLGLSAEKRKISGITVGNVKAREQVVLVGRQHPPEVTGALAMFPFVEALTADTPLATKFRERFQTIVVPMLNPDGVVRGHWRHNTGGIDLNRDWGPFTQPETKLMDGLLKKIDQNPKQKLRLLLDFHSTQKDVFYTIPDEYPTNPPLFIRDWLKNYQEKMSGYNVNRDARHSADRPISKAYSYETYGVPAVTFEIGDETDRGLIQKIGHQSAVAMMETLLATDAQ